ncbi:MAG TPA: RNA polymerase sigma factor [Cyclobacteriaceae bacterium]|nr:RNA polymerase sigma factor [Cyclobacteriaceae bacterium]
MEKSFLKDINEHQGIILKVCSMYCDDRDDSEDLFQEIVLQLWKSYSGFKGEAKISTWMYRVALNTAITRLRKTKRRPDNQRLGNDNFDIAEVANNRLDIQFSAELQQAINMLNRVDRALMMLYLDETSYSEIAEIIGISESNVGVKINRIKNRLKSILNPT